MQHFETKIIENKKIVSNFYLLSFEYEKEAPKPGQFINLQIKPFLLKRPFAIFDYDPGKLCILYRVLGEGTKAMTTLKPGHSIEILAPLGNGFQTSSSPSVIIAGGTGIAPVYYFLKTITGEKTCFIGVNNQEEAKAFEDLFSRINCRVEISTLDGSFGYKGNVVAMSLEKLKEKKDYNIYACGPHGMFEAIYQNIQQKKYQPAKAYVSLEARMGCGFGICLGCAVEKKNSDAFFYVCKDGPVFDIEDIKWNS